MKPDQRVVTSIPLHELWNDQGTLSSERLRYVTREEIRSLLRDGQIRFVIASVGHKLKWIEAAHCYEHWKNEAGSRVCEPDVPFQLEDFPDGKVFLASLWTSEKDKPIVVFEVHH